jgi:hypothetical protein
MKTGAGTQSTWLFTQKRGKNLLERNSSKARKQPFSI